MNINVTNEEGVALAGTEWEKNLIEQNCDLVAQRQRMDSYYRALLDMESCGILAYTLPGHTVRHMNAEALRIFGVRDQEEAQNRLGELLRSVEYPDFRTEERLKALRQEDNSVDYECVIHASGGMATIALARTEVFLTPEGERSLVTTFLDISENKAVKRERNILDALCADYTCVYYCDLDRDWIKAVKEGADTNAGVEEGHTEQELHSYSFRLQYYFDHYVIQESAPDALEKLSAAHLKKYLADNERFAYRFRTRPNPAGRQFFEVQVARLPEEGRFCTVMGYRFMDDLVAEQERQKALLEDALTKVKENKALMEKKVTSLTNIHAALTSGAWNLMYNSSGELIAVNWSDTLRHMLGFESTKDFPNTFEAWADRLHPQDKKYTLDMYERTLGDCTGKTVFDVEYRLQSKNLEYHWYRATGSLSRREDGSPQSFDGVFINMDEKHATSEKLHRVLEEAQKAKEELMLDHEIISAVSRLYFSLYRIDLNKDFYEEISSDSSIHRLTGHEGKAQRKMYELCNTIVSKEYREAVRHFFDLSTVPGRMAQTDTVEIEYFATDGNWHQARFIEKKRDGNGRVTHILYVTRIVSQEKRQELEQQRLQVAYQVAESANEAKTTFLLNMSHDIRTPMNAILGYCELMRERLTDPDLIHYQEMIDQSGKVLMSIINNVLDMARIESGKVVLDENCNKTGDIISSVCNVFTGEAQKKGVQLTHETTVEHPYLLCDITKLQEIFTNLISNAVKYTPSGGKIWVTTREEPGPKSGWVVIETVVADTGIGMSKEYLPHLFESFTRERSTTVGKIMGTGLGMPIVKSLVDLMGGTIDVQSELGKGSRFTVRIPHKIASESYYKKKNLPESAGLEANFEGKHILLAEDNDLNAEIAMAILEKLGFTVERAEDGVVCVDKIERTAAGAYDLILMDIQMPNMDGYRATQEIRSLSEAEKANIPIVAMTANAFDEDRKKASQMGMNGHIAKPIDVEILKTTLASVLTQKKAE